MPLAHVSLPCTSVPASKAFYQTVLAPLGYAIFLEVGDATVGFAPPRANPDFWLHTCPDEAEFEAKKGSTVKTQKTHVAFQVGSRDVVRAFHATALKAGATCNGPPGERDYTKGYYAAFVLDLDGNNIECMHWRPWWLVAVQGAPMVVGAAVVGLGSWWLGSGGAALMMDTFNARLYGA